MNKEQLDSLNFKLDNTMARFDTFMTKRRIKADQDRRKMADARIAKSQKKLDDYTEAKHPRNANGVFVTGEGEEGKEDTQMKPGCLSKKDPL